MITVPPIPFTSTLEFLHDLFQKPRELARVTRHGSCVVVSDANGSCVVVDDDAKVEASVISMIGGPDDRIDRLDNRIGRLENRLDRGFDRMDERFQRIDERFQRIDERFERMDAKMDRQFRWLVGILFTAMLAMLGILGSVLPVVFRT